MGIGAALTSFYTLMLPTGMGAVTLATTAAILSTATLLAGAMVVANALKPKIPDAGLGGQGQILSTTKSNTDAVPVVYGENKLAGNIIWQKTNNYSGGTTNKDYWAIIALADGTSQDFLKAYNKEVLMTDQGSGVFTSEYVQMKGYTSSGEGVNINDIDFPVDNTSTTELGSTVIGGVTAPSVSSTSYGSAANLIDGSTGTGWAPSYIADEWIMIVDNTNASIESVVVKFTINFYTPSFLVMKLQYSDNGTDWEDASNTISGGGFAGINIINHETDAHNYWRIYLAECYYSSADESGSYTYPLTFQEVDYISSIGSTISIPPNITYMTVHQLYDATDGAHVQLSNIMVELQGKVIDYFTATGIAASPTYTSSPPAVVYDIMKERLNITEDDIDIDSWYDAQTFADSNELRCNIVYAQQQNTASAIEAALASMRGHITYSNNKWRLIYDHPQTSLRTLTSADILENSMSVSMASSTDIANTVIVKYINPEDEWQIASVGFKEEELIVFDGQVSEYILEVKACTSQSQASKLAELTLNKMRYSEDSLGNRIKQTPLSISFATSIKNADIEVGDVYTIDHSLLNYARNFEIVSVETDQSGVLNIEATEHCATHYKDSVNNDIIT